MDFWHKKIGKGGHSPGLYLHIDPSESFVASGVWHPETPVSNMVRKTIVEHPDSWKRVLDTGLKFWGESLKRPPLGFDPSHQFIQDLKRKDFVSTVALTTKQITGPNFMEDVVAAGRSMNPLNRFLAEAMGLTW